MCQYFWILNHWGHTQFLWKTRRCYHSLGEWMLWIAVYLQPFRNGKMNFCFYVSMLFSYSSNNRILIFVSFNFTVSIYMHPEVFVDALKPDIFHFQEPLWKFIQTSQGNDLDSATWNCKMCNLPVVVFITSKLFYFVPETGASKLLRRGWK
jgi:hypothetical protein